MRFRPLKNRAIFYLAVIALAALAFMREPGTGAFVVMPVTAPDSAERYPAQENPVDDSTAEADRKVEDLPQNGALWPTGGERWIYRFERKAMATYQGKIWLKLALGGRAAIELLPTKNANRFYLLTSEIDRLEMQEQTQRSVRKLPSVRFEVEPTGKLREMRFVANGANSARVSEEDQDVVKDLVSQWLFFETETRLGRAEIDWRSPPTKGEIQTLAKRILRYPSRPEVAKLDSNHEWTTKIEKAGPRPPGAAAFAKRVDRVEGTENFTLASSSGDFDQQTSYRWLWISTEPVSPLATLALGESFGVTEPSSGGEVPGKGVDATRVATGWKKVAAMAPHERLRFFREAKRFLEKSAVGSGEVRAIVSLVTKELRGKSSTSIEWRTGIGILAATSNAEAQTALHELYREPNRSSDEKLSILAGVAAGEGAPISAWKGTLEQQIENDPEASVREASVYALGSAIRKETDPAKRTELEGVLWREIKDARTEPAQLVVLDAIGNSGSGEYYPYLKEQSESSSVRVRAKTALAVRFLAAEQARPILERAKVDPSPTVRKAASQSASVQAEAATSTDE